jgi:L-asparaginase
VAAIGLGGLTPDAKPRIAVFAGPAATILNSPPLVTSNLARRRAGLPPRLDAWGRLPRFDVLRPQRLAKPVTVYVEQFSAHPMEHDAAELYAEPDGWMDRAGTVHRRRRSAEDIPVYEIELRPEDGLLPLPFMGRQRDGSPWEDDCAEPGADPSRCRQPFYPDAARVFEEIDRLGIDGDGVGNQLGGRADFDFIRVLPSAGYTRGLPAEQRTDLGAGDVPPERLGEDYFPYRPRHLRYEPVRAHLATVTNAVQAALAGDGYRGGLWLEGSPFVEETVYWLNLLVDATVPIVACASADWPHGGLAASGDRALVDAVCYVCSGVWSDAAGRDRVGAVLIHAEQIFAAREVQKADARPGGYVATGGHGGVVGSTGEPGPPVLTYLPVRRHTHRSEVRLSRLPFEVSGVRWVAGAGVRRTAVRIRDDQGRLLGEAIPRVSILKHARYQPDDSGAGDGGDVEVLGQVERALASAPLAGFVVEGSTPYGGASPGTDAALRRAALCGVPVVRVARGNAEGFVAAERVRSRLSVAGANLTATKARLLLMACLLRFGALPPAADPDRPTEAEIGRIREALASYQAVFDTH